MSWLRFKPCTYWIRIVIVPAWAFLLSFWVLMLCNPIDYYSSDHLTSRDPEHCIAAVIGVRSLLVSPQISQAVVYLFQIHLLCWDYICSFSHGRLCCNRYKIHACACSLLPFLPACYLILLQQIIKQWGHCYTDISRQPAVSICTVKMEVACSCRLLVHMQHTTQHYILIFVNVRTLFHDLCMPHHLLLWW